MLFLLPPPPLSSSIQSIRVIRGNLSLLSLSELQSLIYLLFSFQKEEEFSFKLPSSHPLNARG